MSDHVSVASPASAPPLPHAERAYRSLLDRLIVLDIVPGAPLNDGEIGRELGIGRTPVREALKRLETERLVTVYPRRGTFASTVDISDLAEISEIRALLEPLAAERAARVSSPQERAELRALADELDTAGEATAESSVDSLRESMRDDLRVHRLIYRCSGNRHLEETLTQYSNLATRIWCVALDRTPGIHGSVLEHVGLLRAIADGDGATAAALARDHVVHFEELIRTVL